MNIHTLASGPFFVETVPNSLSITFTARATGTITSGPITGVIYSRPDCYYTHRPFDGGVLLGTGGPAHGALAVRQSKKYIRYQSGKAVNYNTGALSYGGAYNQAGWQVLLGGGFDINLTKSVAFNVTDLYYFGSNNALGNSNALLAGMKFAF